MMNTLVLAPFFLITLLVFAVAIRRVLGVRVGPGRTLLAALLALLITQPLLQGLLGAPSQSDDGTRLAYLALSVATASLLAMIVVVLAEVLVPDGSLPGPMELWRGWRTRVGRARRYAQILRIALRHGLGRFLRGRRHSGLASSTSRRELARSLRSALDEGGVTFVKLGQQLSTRRDLLPVEFVEELTRLQDHAAPIPWPEVESLLTTELGGPIDTVFADLDPEPIAAASVAQVHGGRLLTGEEVIVKVQRPGVLAVVERDLDILDRLATTLEARTAWGRSLGASALAAGFAEALREELDFTIERDNMRAFGAVLGAGRSTGTGTGTGTGRVSIVVPTPVEDLSTARVLVMDRLEGTPLGAAGPVLAGWDPGLRRDVADRLLESVFDQVLVHGIFHVDLHPGNVLVRADGGIGVLDFGSVGRLDSTTRIGVGRLMLALGRGDSTSAGDALLDLVDRPEHVDERALERAVGALLVRYTTPGVTAGAAAFAALFRLVTTHGLGIPAQVAAVFRTFATLEGTLNTIDPRFDLVARTRTLGESRLTDALAPGQARRTLEDELATLLPMLRRLPRRVDRIADALEHGRLSLRLRLLADPGDRRTLTELLHQTLLTVLGAAAGVMSVMLLGISGGPKLTAQLQLFPVLGWSLLIISVVLVLRVLVVIFRQDPA